MTDLGKLVYTLTLNDEGFGEQVAADTQKVKESGEEMSSSMEDTAASTDKLGGAFGGMVGQFVEGAAIFTAGQKIITTIKSAIDDAMQSAKDWQTQQAGLNAELTSTHDASGLTAEQLINLAEQTQALTPISRQAALEGENMLLTFTNLGSTVFPQVVQATNDMATRMAGGAIPTGQQLSQTALQIGKALNDPINGLSKLQREGVTFTQQQKDQVKAMQDAGNMAGAQSIMIAELNKEFGGSAAANMDTYQGKLADIKNRFDDLVGGAIAKLTAALQKMGEFLLNHEGILATLGGAVLGLAAAIGVALVGALWAVVAPALAAVVALSPIILIGAAIGGIAFLIITNWSKIRPVLQPIYDFFVANILPILQQVAGFVGGQFKAAWNDLTKAFDQLVNTLKPFAPQLKIIAEVIGVALLVPLALAVAGLVAFVAVVVAVITIGARLIGWIAEAVAAFVQFQINVDKVMGAFIGSVVGAISQAINWYMALPGKIINALIGADKWLIGVGENIINGLITGIENNINHAVASIRNAGQSIINAAKDVLKIFSPSQVFSDIGANVSLGLAKGITDTSSRALDATAQLTTGVVSTGAKSLSTIPNVANNSSSASSSVTYDIAQVVLQGAEAVDEFFNIGNRNTQLEGIGFAPLAGTTGV